MLPARSPPVVPSVPLAPVVSDTPMDVPIVSDTPSVPQPPLQPIKLEPIKLERQTTTELPETPKEPFEAIVQIPVEELPYLDEKPPEGLWMPAAIVEKHEAEKQSKKSKRAKKQTGTL